ncbi:unnamed protein product [Rhodiola kirilowii]
MEFRSRKCGKALCFNGIRADVGGIRSCCVVGGSTHFDAA